MIERFRGHVRSVLAVAGWLAAAAGATTVGVVALGAVGSGIVGTAATPMTRDQVAGELAQASQASSPQRTATSPATPGGVPRAIGVPGGIIIARCSAGQVTLGSWSPAQGYETDDVRRGPARAATMTFETEDTENDVRVTCRAGVPMAHTTTEADHDHD